jgi:flagellar basal body-associated protein FliL
VKVFGVPLVTVIVIAIVAIVAYHYWMQKQGVVAQGSKPHAPRGQGQGKNSAAAASTG